MEIITENNVVEYVKRGEDRAFRFIFDTYYPYMCVVAKGYLCDNFLAETVAGDVVYNIWEIRENLEIHTSLKAYLIRSVKNRCINYLERDYVLREISPALSEDRSYIEELYFISEEHPIAELEGKELSEKIDTIVGEFPVECQKVFILSRYENMKYEEIAEKLNISVNTVKYHIKNALLKLRTDLKDYLMYMIILMIMR